MTQFSHGREVLSRLILVFWRQQEVCEPVGIGLRACGKSCLCHIGHMKVVSIRELHEHTGELVRHALKEPILVTDRGQQVAVLKSITGAESSGKLFPKRKLSSLPKVEVDSTIYISEERDAR